MLCISLTISLDIIQLDLLIVSHDVKHSEKTYRDKTDKNEIKKKKLNCTLTRVNCSIERYLIKIINGILK